MKYPNEPKFNNYYIVVYTKGRENSACILRALFTVLIIIEYFGFYLLYYSVRYNIIVLLYSVILAIGIKMKCSDQYMA